ncbi:MAG: hypothetical protein SGCHY_002540, partial [Lobulomycetales sp.]
MKAIVCKTFGKEPRELLSLENDWEKPQPDQRDSVLIRVLTCSISPGDWRNMNGSTAYVRSPPSFPFIPCHDVCGIVEVAPEDSGFKPGDR